MSQKKSLLKPRQCNLSFFIVFRQHKEISVGAEVR